jgi:molybdenum cofactor biosynthesis enzyme
MTPTDPSGFTHVRDGMPTMVDVAAKPATTRTALA